MERLTMENHLYTNSEVRLTLSYDDPFIVKCLNRLSAYEDIGLTPEQLREVDELYLKKCEELNAHKGVIEELKERYYGERQRNTL